MRDVASAGVALAAGVALGVSIVRRRAGVAGQREEQGRRSARVAAMTGIEREVAVRDPTAAEFPPALDLVAPAIGALGLVAAAIGSGGPDALAIFRFLVGEPPSRERKPDHQ